MKVDEATGESIQCEEWAKIESWGNKYLGFKGGWHGVARGKSHIW